MYARQGISIAFYRKLRKINSKGKVPIYARVAVDGQENELATGIFVIPEYWNPDYQLVKPDDPDFLDHNNLIGMIRVGLKNQYVLQTSSVEAISPKMVIDAYKASQRHRNVIDEKPWNLEFSDAIDNLLEDYKNYDDRHRKLHKDGNVLHPERLADLNDRKVDLDERIEKLAKKGATVFDDNYWQKTLILAVNEQLMHFLQLTSIGQRAANTLEKMWGRKRRILEFLEYRYEALDIPLQDLDLKFLAEYHKFNLIQYQVEPNTATRYVQAVKETINRCVFNGWLESPILTACKCHYDKSEADWLTMEEMIALMKADFSSTKLNQARDFYVFSAFTGLAYAELTNLAPEHIVKGFDGKLWIDLDRKKTGVRERLPLLPVALDLIEKYKNDRVSMYRGKIFPITTNQDYNRSLKEIAAIMGFRIRGRSHEGRYFFANEVAYNNGVQPRTVGRMLGQKCVKSIDTYIRPGRNAISKSMMEVKEKLFDSAGSLKQSASYKGKGAKVIAMWCSIT